MCCIIDGAFQESFRLGHLQTLSVITALDFETPSQLKLVLSHIIAPNLHQIRFQFHSLPPRMFWLNSLLPIQMRWRHWVEIDRVLESHGFPALRSLKITSPFGEDIDTFRKNFLKHLPSLASRGIVEIEDKHC
jgi:hypothetical protein